jgi:hypothetical protein
MLSHRRALAHDPEKCAALFRIPTIKRGIQKTLERVPLFLEVITSRECPGRDMSPITDLA